MYHVKLKLKLMLAAPTAAFLLLACFFARPQQHALLFLCLEE
jgi:hypothetical protein